MINERVNGGFQPKAPAGDSPPVPLAEPISAPTAATKSDEAQTATPAVTELEQVNRAVQQLNEHVQNIRRTLSFSVEESTGRTVISVYNSETDELIRQIPPDEALLLAERLQAHAGGSVLLNERV